MAAKPPPKLKLKKPAPKLPGVPIGDPSLKKDANARLHRPAKGKPPIVMGRSTGGLVNQLVVLGHDYTYRISLVDNELKLEALTNPQTINERVDVTRTFKMKVDPYTLKVEAWANQAHVAKQDPPKKTLKLKGK